MAIVEENIKNEVINLIKNNTETDSDKAIEYFATKIAKVIAEAIKSGTVTVQAGILVQVAVPTGTGATTGPGTGSIS